MWTKFGGKIFAALADEGACEVAKFSLIRLALKITLGVESLEFKSVCGAEVADATSALITCCAAYEV